MARKLEMSSAEVGFSVEREEVVAHEKGYHLIEFIPFLSVSFCTSTARSPLPCDGTR